MEIIPLTFLVVIAFWGFTALNFYTERYLLLLFPLVVPVLMASCKALALVLTGDPMGQMRSWALLLLCFDLIYWSLGGILFPFVIEEG